MGNLSTKQEAKHARPPAEEDEAMALFKRRSPVRQDEQPSATTQNVTSQQYGDPGGPGPQYGDSSTARQYERADRANQAIGTPRGDVLVPRGLPGGWLGEIVLGLGSLVLGLIVSFHPIHTLNALAITLGVLMVISGVYHVVRSLRRAGDHRMWGGIAGVLFFLTGIFLLRHMALSLAIISLFAGFAFVIAGVAGLAEAISGHNRVGRVWSAFFGIVCLFAGIAAITSPIHTLNTLAILLGWVFFGMGIMYIVGAFVSRRVLRDDLRRAQLSVPGPRATQSQGAADAYGAAPDAPVAASTAAPRHRRSRL
jgi:uncharacterized membrane protein HdeD (DUF308 family)